MQRKLQILAALAAGVALVGLAACGDDDDSASDTTTTTAAPSDTTAASGGVSAEDYVASVCTDIGDWATELDTVGAELEDAASKDDFIATLGELKTLTTALVADVTAAGPPDIDGGEDIASTLEASIAGYVDAVDEATTLAESLPEDQNEAQEGIEQIFSDLGAAGSEIADTLSNVPPGLQDAVDAEPACTALIG
jgi:hypothetical protein